MIVILNTRADLVIDSSHYKLLFTVGFSEGIYLIIVRGDSRERLSDKYPRMHLNTQHLILFSKLRRVHQLVKKMT